MSADPPPRPPESVAEAMKGWPGRQAWEQPPEQPKSGVIVELLHDLDTDRWWAALVNSKDEVFARYEVTAGVTAIIAAERAKWEGEL